MSKLGNVYELDFNTRMKNKYPVVYINDGYIVCKCNGTNLPKVFKRNNGSIYVSNEVVDYAVFKAMDNSLKDRHYYGVYVPHGMSETFSDFFTQTEAEKELKRAQGLLRLLSAATWNLNNLQRQLGEIQNKINQAQKNIADKQTMVDKYKKIIAEEAKQK